MAFDADLLTVLGVASRPVFDLSRASGGMRDP